MNAPFPVDTGSVVGILSYHEMREVLCRGVNNKIPNSFSAFAIDRE